MRRIFYRGHYCRSRELAATPHAKAYYLVALQKVYLIVRKDYLRASVMQKRVLDRELPPCNPHGRSGWKKFVEGAHLIEYAGTDRAKFDIDIDGFFRNNGHKPNTDIFRPDSA